MNKNLYDSLSITNRFFLGPLRGQTIRQRPVTAWPKRDELSESAFLHHHSAQFNHGHVVRETDSQFTVMKLHEGIGNYSIPWLQRLLTQKCYPQSPGSVNTTCGVLVVVRHAEPMGWCLFT